MASIVKRKKKYSVVYTYTDENGNKRQKWETFETNAEAKKRKLQVEYEQESGTFIPPSAKTVNDLLDEYMSIYGVNTWAMSTYESRKSLIANYIRPLIGDMKLEDVTPRIMDNIFVVDPFLRIATITADISVYQNCREVAPAYLNIVSYTVCSGFSRNHENICAIALWTDSFCFHINTSCDIISFHSAFRQQQPSVLRQVPNQS